MKVVIGVPHIRPLEGSFVEGLWALQKPEGTSLRLMPNRTIDDARNRLVVGALESGADYLLFLDGDMRPPAGGLMRLISRDKDVVSGLAFGRCYPHWPVSLAEKCGNDYNVDAVETYKFLSLHRRLWPSVSFRGALLPADTPDALLLREAAGMAFTLIARRVLEKLSPPYFQLNDNGVAGEDAYFCGKAAEAGFDIWLDRSVVVGHGYGDQCISPMDWLTFFDYARRQDGEEFARLSSLGLE